MNPGGDLLLYHHAADGSDIGGARIGTGWGDFARILSARDGHFTASPATARCFTTITMQAACSMCRRAASAAAGRSLSGLGGGSAGTAVCADRRRRSFALRARCGLQLGDAGRVLGGRWGGYRRLFTGGSGCLYAVTGDGVLLYNRHDAGSWIQRGVSMGSGWDNYASLLGSGNGEVYAVKRNGDLCFHRHDANLTWLPGSGLRIGTGWAVYDPYSPLPSLTSGSASIGADSASVTPITTRSHARGFPA